MAARSVPLQDNFPRTHRFCDRCDEPLIGQFAQGEIETAAGCFKYALCSRCCDAKRKMSKAAQSSVMRRALVRHAARYSEQFGAFVAAWYGVKLSRVPSPVHIARGAL